jgi:hypothetical protein
MKKIASLLLLPALTCNIALAAPSSSRGMPASVGVNYSFDDALGTQFEFNISEKVNYAPVSIQLFWKSYPQHINSNAIWNTSGLGIAGIYDLTAISKFDKQYHPYLGLGLISVSHSWAGNGPIQNYTGRSSGLYGVGGVRYSFSREISGDLNLNSFGGLTVGANFNF